MNKPQVLAQPTADAVFAHRVAELRTIIHSLQDEVADFEAKQRLDKRNWGYAGSLEYVVKQVKQARNHLRGVEE